MTKPGWVAGPGSVIARTINGSVTINVISGSPDPIRDAIFDPSGLEKALDLAHFTGREWLIRRIDDYIAAPDHDRGYIVVQAEAGVGKSALAAHLVWTRLCAHHFTRLTGGQSPVAARRNLAAQLIVGWDLTDELTKDGNFPKSANSPNFLVRVLRQAAQRRNKLYPGAPLVLVVDGLDEAAPPAPGPDGDDQDTGIPLGLPRPDDLPAGVFIVATTRFGLVIPNLADPDSWHEIVVDGADNLADMHRYLTAAVTGPTAQPALVRLLDQHPVEPALFASKLAGQCNGVWIYLRYVLDAILRGQRSPADLGSLPANLAKYYLDEIWPWRRLSSWATAGLPALAVLVGLYRPVSLPELAGLCLTDKESLREWLDGRLRPFLDVTRGPHRQAQYAIRHQSFRDLFTADDGDDTEPWAPQRTALREAFTDTHTRLAAAHRQAAAEWTAQIGELPEARYETVEHLFRARHHLTFASPWEQTQCQEADAAQITALLLGDPPAADDAAAALLTAVLLRYAEDTAEPSLLGLMEFVEEPSFYSGPQILSYLSDVTDPDRPAHTAAAQIANQFMVDYRTFTTEEEDTAERMLDRVREAILGPLLDVRAQQRDPVYLRVADSIGSSRPAQAERLYREVLATRQRQARDHPDRADANLAVSSLCERLADLLTRDAPLAAEAQPLLEQALEIKDRVLGAAHPDTVTAVERLRVMLNDLLHELGSGTPASPQPLCDRAVRISERVAGYPHERTAISLNNLAVQLWNRGDLAGARQLFEQSIQIRERLAAPADAEGATTLNNLGILLDDLGDLAGARPLLEQALQIREQVAGLDAQATVNSLHCLGRLRQHKGEFAPAEQLLERALQISQRRGDNADTAYSLYRLGRLRHDQGDLPQARQLLEQAHDIWQRDPSQHQFQIAWARWSLGALRYQLGELAEARLLLEQALDILEANGAPDHPDTAVVVHDLARVRRDQGELAEARTLAQRALRIRADTLGPDHPDTVASRDYLTGLPQMPGAGC